MTALTADDLTDPSDVASVRRGRLALLAVAIAVTAVIAVVGGLAWPSPAEGDWFSYADIAPIRHRWWLVATVLAVGAVVGIPAQALAAMSLARSRGARWATAGAVLMWLGAGLEATGGAGWAMLYYFTTDPALETAAGTGLLDAIVNDPRLFAAGLLGAVAVALGTVLQAVGLWRSRALPRWVPILTLAVVPTFFLPNEGVAGLVTALPMAVGAVALGWYAWRRA